MHYGLVYPQTEFPRDPLAIRDYAQQAEELGYSHLVVFDHILGANPDRPGGWTGSYTYRHPFMEPFVLFSYLAGLTSKIGFATGIVILPQRQTALFAKQAATLDVLSNGRLRLGVGNGWNMVEYTALNEDFHTRGRRIEEQVTVLRLLWTQELVSFHGRWHEIPDAGLNPLPVQRPIPIWFGGHEDRVLQRTARLGDGWMPTYRRAAYALQSIERIRSMLQEAGRDPAKFGLEARVPFGDGTPETWLQLIQEWKDVGATHITFNPLGAGFTAIEQYFAAMRRFAQAAGLQ